MHKLLAGRRVLVVEDEMMVLMLMEDILSDLGCESITVAADVKQAIALINAQMFDAAMLDVNLNGDKSFPIADALATKNVHSSLRRVMASTPFPPTTATAPFWQNRIAVKMWRKF